MSISDGKAGDMRKRPAASKYITDANKALEQGDSELAVFLLLAASNQLSNRFGEGCDAAVDCLRQAMDLTIESGLQDLVDCVFEKLRAFIDPEEDDRYTTALSDMALDRLQSYGVSRDDLTAVADALSNEFDGQNILEGVFPSLKEPKPEGECHGCDCKDDKKGSVKVSTLRVPKTETTPTTKTVTRTRFKYDDLVGFDTIIQDAHALGLGLTNDERYKSLIDVLKARHGIEGLSAIGSIVFRTSSREDAARFMDATVGELDVPAMRVHMTDGPYGVPALGVSVTSDKTMPAGKSAMLPFNMDAPGILILEDIDSWGAMLINAATQGEDCPNVPMNATRAAQEAVHFIRSAVESPNTYVLASVDATADDQQFVYDLLEPMSIIDVYLPDSHDRRALWNHIALEHPSIRNLNLNELTRLSKNVSRCNIDYAAQQAIEEAYKQSLQEKHYVPVTQSLMYEFLANYQPLDSEEYRLLEDAVAKSFMDSLSFGDFDFLPEANDGDEGAR